VLLANICKKTNTLEVINLRISQHLKMSIKTLKFCCFIFAITCFYNCTTSDNKDSITATLFTSLPLSATNIDFKNTVKEDLYFNFLNYPYIYNGGGVAVGDINNDGLEDIYFTANQNSNKLYINKGDLEFKDITNNSNTKDDKGWSTGVTMVDINNDGWLDIYVCKSGSLQDNNLRKNKLFINQKNNTFKEEASKYGVDHFGFSVQSYFFDFDNDGDLDLYLVNHRPDFRNNNTINLEDQKNIKEYSSDQLFRNENGLFTNITKTAGISNKAWGLSASIGDFNNDNLLDIYVANDFLQPDFLYINNGDGTFSDKAQTQFKHISSNSMGSDFADVNNDLKPDLIVLDMMAEDHIRSKKNMATMSTQNFNTMVSSGYHHQYMSNILQLNNANGTYSEIGQLAGIAKTDWSWAPLIADFDNDGFNDLFITNGIENDLSNQDFRNNMRKNIMNRKKVSLDEAINMMPSDKLQNYVFKNNRDLTFKKSSDTWGITEKINSNGAAYADLDNDGDLDLIINNQAETASIYRNNSTANFVSFTLKGSDKNKNGIGAKVTVFTANKKQYKEAFVSRGFQSSVTSKIHFGLGNENKIDSVHIQWNSTNSKLLKEININQNEILDYSNSTIASTTQKGNSTQFEPIDPTKLGISYQHKENTFNDLDIQLLLPQKQSENTSALAVADVNNDGLEDFFVGNSKGVAAEMYIQKMNGKFAKSNQQLFKKEKDFEDTNALFFDANNDGKVDLYVTSGGYELKENHPLLQDRLYMNNGKGKFTKSTKLPSMLSYTKAITASDFDNDGDLDLFVGSRVIPGKYPLSNPSYLLENKKGKFVNVTEKKLNGFSEIKIANDALFSDFDNDGDQDLIVVGEWMEILFYENNKGVFNKKNIPALEKSEGWQQSIKEFDMNGNGLKDYLIGNWGNNNKFHPTAEKPLHIYADYLDNNDSFDIVLSKESKGKMVPVRGKECSTQQTPFLGKKIGNFSEFANASLGEIYGDDKLQKATHYKAYNFNSLVLKNLGNGNFEIIHLPNQAQFSPTLDFTFIDNQIIGIGNVYDAEVETIRYDASQGYVLSKTKLNTVSNTGFSSNKEAKSVETIVIKGKQHLIILNKNETISLFKKN
jgi:hypothetical protein